MGIFDFFNKKDKKPESSPQNIASPQSTPVPQATPSAPKRYMKYQGKRMEIVSENFSSVFHQERKTLVGNTYQGTGQVTNYVLQEEQNGCFITHRVNGTKPTFVPTDMDYAAIILEDFLAFWLKDEDFDLFITRAADNFVNSYHLVKLGEQYEAKGDKVKAAVCYDSARLAGNIIAAYKSAECFKKGYIGEVDPQKIYETYNLSSDYYLPGIIQAVKCQVESDRWMDIITNLNFFPESKELLELLNEYKPEFKIKNMDDLIKFEDDSPDTIGQAQLATLCYLTNHPEKARKFALEALSNLADRNYIPYAQSCIILACLEAQRNNPDFTLVMRYVLNGLAFWALYSIVLLRPLCDFLDAWISGKPGYPKISPKEKQLATKVLLYLASRGINVQDATAVKYMSKYLKKSKDENMRSYAKDLSEIAKNL